MAENKAFVLAYQNDKRDTLFCLDLTQSKCNLSMQKWYVYVKNIEKEVVTKSVSVKWY